MTGRRGADDLWEAAGAAGVAADAMACRSSASAMGREWSELPKMLLGFGVRVWRVTRRLLQQCRQRHGSGASSESGLAVGI